MLVDDFSFHLPEHLIAQKPVEPRDSARLLVVNRSDFSVTHAHVRDLPSLLSSPHVLVRNNSKVRKARLYGTHATKQVELLVVEAAEGECFRCLIRAKGLKPGTVITLAQGGTALLKGFEEGPAMHTATVCFHDLPLPLEEYLETYGEMPLPPYIAPDASLSDRYQTVYAETTGSVAAPTAGLHFTDSLIQKLEQAGHTWTDVTLHVGLGTFLPLRNPEVNQNQLHSERIDISPQTAHRITEAKRAGIPVLAIGTTSTRTIESAWKDNELVAGNQETQMYIYPGYQFKVADALLTNFHLPGSSLLLLVSAFLIQKDPKLLPADASRILQSIYQEAIAKEYRFYSFGDAMLIL